MSVFKVDHIGDSGRLAGEKGLFISKNGQMPMYLTYEQCEELAQLLWNSIPKTQSRIDLIGQNGNDGLHYA